MSFLFKTKTLKKIISSFTMLTTVIAFTGIVSLASVAVAADAIVDGDLIKSNAINSDGTPTIESLDVYIVKVVADKKFKRLILSPTVFESYGHLNYGDIMTVSQAVMDEYATSALVRVDTDPAEKVYAMAPSGDTGAKGWVNLTTTQFVDEASSDADSIYTINAVDGASYTTVGDVTTVVELTTFYTSGDLPDLAPVSTDGVTAALSATTPAASTLVTGQAVAHLADFTFSGTGTVKSVTVKRIGISADITASNLYLFDGDTRITDSASFSAGSLATFSATSLFEVNGTKTISVKSDIATGTAGQTIGVELTGATLSAGDMTGLPVAGNLHGIASATLATVAMSAASGSGDVNAGTGILVWQGTATVGTRDVLLNRLALRQVGSINTDDINNFVLNIGGTDVETVDSLTDGYVTFSTSQAMKTGARIIKVYADVIGGAGRTVQMSLRGAYDITSVDTQYNSNVLATGTFPFGPSAFTVNSGTMTVVKASDSQSSNITIGASDTPFATFNMTAYGEAIKVETLLVDIDETGGVTADITFDNVRIMVDGSQVGSSTDVPAASAGVSFTTNFTVNPGETVAVQIRGDVVDSNITIGTATDDIAAGTVTALTPRLDIGSGNGVPQTSITGINVPTGVVSGNALTISSGTITLAQTSTYAAQTTVVPQTAYKLGSFQLLGNSTESVTLNTIEVDFTNGDTFDASDDLTDLYVVYDGNQGTTKGTVTDIDNTWSISHTLAINETIQVDVFANIGSSIVVSGGDDQITALLTVTGVTDLSATTVYADGTDNSAKDAGETGQIIDAGTGTITITKDASAPNSAIVDDSGTITSGAFKITTTNDSYTVTDITLTLADASAVSSVILREAGSSTAIEGGTKPGATSLTFSGLSIPVDANANKVIEVDLVLGAVGVGAGTTGSSLLTTLTAATAKNSQGNSSAGNVTESDPAGNVMYIYKAIPTITVETLPSTTLIAGTGKTISKFTVSSSGGTIAWKQALVTVTKTGGGTPDGTDKPTVASPTLWDVTSGSPVQVTAAIVIQNNDAGTADTTCLAAATSCEILISVGTNADDDVEEQVSGSKTYELRATIGGTLADNDYINTTIGQNQAFLASAIFTGADNDLTAADATFSWSDVSAQSHDTGTIDWTTDYLVRNLPTVSQGLTK